MEPDRRSLQTLFAFAYGMQVGRMRRIAAELQKLAQQAQLATMASGAAIAIAAQNQIECIARSGIAAPSLGSKPEAAVGLSGECIRTGIPQFCADTETHPFVDRMHSRTVGVRAIVYVPLFRGVQPAGVIGVFSDTPGHFTQHDMRVLQLIAREVTKVLKWEPNPSALFPPASAITPPEPAAFAAAAAMLAPAVEPAAEPSALGVDEENSVTEAAAESFAAPFTETGERTDARDLEVFADPLPLETSEPEIPATDAVVAEEQAIESPPPAQPLFSEPEPEEVEFAEHVPTFLLGQERRFPRWASVLAIVVAIGSAVGLIWWFTPLWAPKKAEPAIVYGPPQVTRDTPSADQTQAPPSGDLAAVASRPGLSEVPDSKAANSALVPTAFVKTVKTQVVGSHTFVSVYLSGPAQFQAHELTNPNRIYIDLHGVEVSPELKDAKIAGVGPVADFRFAKSDGIARLVMVLDAPCTYLVSVTSDPYVIVFDVQPLRIPHPGAARRKGPGDPGF